MKDDLIKLSRYLVIKLTTLCDFENKAMLDFMEYFIKTVCAKELPTVDGKKELLERAADWDKALRAVCADDPKRAEIYFLLDWIADVMMQIATMKCGGP